MAAFASLPLAVGVFWSRSVLRTWNDRSIRRATKLRNRSHVSTAQPTSVDQPVDQARVFLTHVFNSLHSSMLFWFQRAHAIVTTKTKFSSYIGNGRYSTLGQPGQASSCYTAELGFSDQVSLVSVNALICNALICFTRVSGTNVSEDLPARKQSSSLF